MCDALDGHEGSISIGGRLIANFRFADDTVVNACWELQIDLVCQSVSRKLTLMKLLSKQYYNSYVLPVFDFGCVVWGNTTNANLTRLVKKLIEKSRECQNHKPQPKLQKRAARMIS